MRTVTVGTIVNNNTFLDKDGVAYTRFGGLPDWVEKGMVLTFEVKVQHNAGGPQNLVKGRMVPPNRIERTPLTTPVPPGPPLSDVERDVTGFPTMGRIPGKMDQRAYEAKAANYLNAVLADRGISPKTTSERDARHFLGKLLQKIGKMG